MKYLILNNNNSVVLTNISDHEFLSEIQKCQKDYERVNCPVTKNWRRQGRIQLLNHIIFVTTEEEITNKIFKHKLSGIRILGDLLDSSLSKIKDTEGQKTRRLKHNLINHNSKVLQELFKLIPQDKFKADSNHVDIIQHLITSNPRKAAFTYLKVLKSANLMKAEFEVYEMFNTENPYLDFLDHPIHKILILTLNPFWLDLVEKQIDIKIDSCFDRVNIDYKSISVAFSHIFDNTSKYIMPHSYLYISFNSDGADVCVQFDMKSLKVEENEVADLFKESNSGKWATELDLNGDGIGMFAIKKLLELNHGSIYFKKDFNNSGELLLDGIPYENNRIVVKLKKSA